MGLTNRAGEGEAGGEAEAETGDEGESKDKTKDDSKKPAENPEDCKDKNVPGRPSDCSAMRSYCNNVIYKELMSQQCP